MVEKHWLLSKLQIYLLLAALSISASDSHLSEIETAVKVHQLDLLNATIEARVTMFVEIFWYATWRYKNTHIRYSDRLKIFNSPMFLIRNKTLMVPSERTLQFDSKQPLSQDISF